MPKRRCFPAVKSGVCPPVKRRASHQDEQQDGRDADSVSIVIDNRDERVGRKAPTRCVYAGVVQKSWFSPAKIAETESSAKTFWIVSARILRPSAPRCCPASCAGRRRRCPVTMSLSISLSAIRSSAGPLKSPCVAHA
jgi:hypothetical protein